jgi:hypothetical protein
MILQKKKKTGINYVVWVTCFEFFIASIKHRRCIAINFKKNHIFSNSANRLSAVTGNLFLFLG